jgi:hypothetical protein
MRISKQRLREIITEELKLVLEADRAPVVFQSDAEGRRSKHTLDVARQATLAGVPAKEVEKALNNDDSDLTVNATLQDLMVQADSGTGSLAVSMLEWATGRSNADQA